MQRQEVDGSTEVKTVGLMVNPKFYQLACSTGGTVTSAREETRLLEIKCPFVLKGKNVLKFDEVLT